MWYFVKHGEVIHAKTCFCLYHNLIIPLQTFELISGDKINTLPYQIQIYYILPFQDLAQREYIRTYGLYVPSLSQFLKVRLPTIMELSFKWNFRLLKLWRFILWSAGLWHGHLLGSNQYLWNMQPTSGSTYRLWCTVWKPTNLTGIYKM